MNARALLVLLFCAVANVSLAQGFAGLGGDAKGYSVPERGTVLTFPADHSSHPQFRIEWWYVTANLKGEDGRDYGVQWTLFRSAMAPREGEGWTSPQIWMGNAALTTPDAHYSAERLARGGIGEAGVTAEPFTAFIDEWRLAAPDAAGLDRLDMAAGGKDFRYDLQLEATGPLVLHGDRGYSVKSESGQASYYYSQPSYRVSGTLKFPGRDMAVTGQAWLDREWSSQPLAADQKGWDWFSLHFETGEKLMGFRLRHTGGRNFVSGTWISADGTATPLTPNALKLTPQATAQVAGRKVPVLWRVELPAEQLDVTVKAVNDAAWVAGRFPYWEGPVRVTGSKPGQGYLEMTGYE